MSSLDRPIQSMLSLLVATQYPHISLHPGICPHYRFCLLLYLQTWYVYQILPTLNYLIQILSFIRLATKEI